MTENRHSAAIRAKEFVREALLKQIEADIEQRFERKVYDEHDHSSSRYSGFDDGFNSGVGEATEAFREAVLRALREGRLT